MSVRSGAISLSATGRKYLRGPRGTGAFLYVRKGLLETLEPPMIDLFAAKWVAPDRYELRPDARRFENWENNYASRLGLGVAVDYALDLGLETIWQRILDLSRIFGPDCPRSTVSSCAISGRYKAGS